MWASLGLFFAYLTPQGLLDNRRPQITPILHDGQGGMREK